MAGVNVENGGAKLERVQLIISRDESAWLDDLAMQIRQQTGAKVSRSELTRAAISTLRELHRQGNAIGFGELKACRTGAQVAQLGVFAIRFAARHAGNHEAGND